MTAVSKLLNPVARLFAPVLWTAGLTLGCLLVLTSNLWLVVPVLAATIALTLCLVRAWVGRDAWRGLLLATVPQSVTIFFLSDFSLSAPQGRRWMFWFVYDENARETAIIAVLAVVAAAASLQYFATLTRDGMSRAQRLAQRLAPVSLCLVLAVLLPALSRSMRLPPPSDYSESRPVYVLIPPAKDQECISVSTNAPANPHSMAVRVDCVTPDLGPGALTLHYHCSDATASRVCALFYQVEAAEERQASWAETDKTVVVREDGRPGVWLLESSSVSRSIGLGTPRPLLIADIRPLVGPPRAFVGAASLGAFLAMIALLLPSVLRRLVHPGQRERFGGLSQDCSLFALAVLWVSAAPLIASLRAGLVL